MLMKALLVLLAIAATLWALGVDVQDLKDSAMHFSGENAQTMTGREDDWD